MKTSKLQIKPSISTATEAFLLKMMQKPSFSTYTQTPTVNLLLPSTLRHPLSTFFFHLHSDTHSQPSSTLRHPQSTFFNTQTPTINRLPHSDTHHQPSSSTYTQTPTVNIRPDIYLHTDTHTGPSQPSLPLTLRYPQLTMIYSSIQ